ncbi:hypothetical protein [Croceicoccus marinus]|jgi:hypothetical protein|uniref:Uncharacterized protein n=1 Tax=Croceicoccus marinus TaxID=450378 RepID=A0A7G6VSF9_9SPHN|nr:hypothetical protein [Croceicoccus marinus]QNE04674.1 hypothetical protein H4O24_12015 [Croceicoccus marinus]
MYIDPKALEGVECETPLDAHHLLNADEGGNAIHGLMIASALSLPLWSAIIYGVSAMI